MLILKGKGYKLKPSAGCENPDKRTDTDTDIRPPGPRPIRILADTDIRRISVYRPVPSYQAVQSEGPSALRPFRPREKEAAAAASFPLRGGVAWTIVQATLSLYLGLFQFIPRMSPHQGGKGRTLGQVHCHWYVCRPDLLFGHPWTRYHMSLWLIIVLCLVLRAYLGHLLSICTQIHQVLSLSPGNNESNGIRY